MGAPRPIGDGELMGWSLVALLSAISGAFILATAFVVAWIFTNIQRIRGRLDER